MLRVVLFWNVKRRVIHVCTSIRKHNRFTQKWIAANLLQNWECCMQQRVLHEKVQLSRIHHWILYPASPSPLDVVKHLVGISASNFLYEACCIIDEWWTGSLLRCAINFESGCFERGDSLLVWDGGFQQPLPSSALPMEVLFICIWSHYLPITTAWPSTHPLSRLQYYFSDKHVFGMLHSLGMQVHAC